MELSVLRSLGLTDDQAKTYKLLLTHGALTPPELAEVSNERRTNGYMALAKLEELGLAKREKINRRLSYRAVSPRQLARLLDESAAQVNAARSELQEQLPALLDTYYTNARRPNVRFYEGRDVLPEIYAEQLAAGENVYFVRTPEDVDESVFNDFLRSYILRHSSSSGSSPSNRLKSKNETATSADKTRTATGASGAHAQGAAIGLMPNYPSAVAWAKKLGKKTGPRVSWYDPDQYSSPVEIAVCGSKTAFISYGDEVVATVIDSPQVAQAMIDLLRMAQGGAKGRRFL